MNHNCANLALLHLYIRSISKKIDKFSNFLGSLALDFSVLGITETWLDNSSHLSDIQGYSFIHNPRVNRDGGGVGLYLAEQFKNRTDLTFVNDCAKPLFVEIIRPTVKKHSHRCYI